jgi:hypothetical protein
MNDRKVSTILSRCLDQIASGEAASACLARYPEQAAELAPLLALAGELGALRDQRLSEAARQRAHARLLRAEVARNDQRATRWLQPGPIAFSRLAAGLIVALFCVVLTTGLVTASQPGDLAYGVRVVVERGPAWLARGPDSRARTELGIAARRLADLDRTTSSPAQDLDLRTVAALLASAESAGTLAAGLSEAEQTEISAQLAEQARHMVQLAAMSRSPRNAALLQAAAGRVERAAEYAHAPAPASGAQPVGPEAGSSVTPVQGDYRTPATEHTGTPILHATPQPMLQPGHTGTPRGREPSVTAPRAGLSATPQGPGPNATGSGPGPSATPQGPGPKATASGPGPSATPQGPSPNATASGPGPSATPQGPGPNATPQGPGLDATPQGSGPDATAPGPGGTGKGDGAASAADRQGTG